MISQFRKEMMHASLNFCKEQETGCPGHCSEGDKLGSL